MPFLFFNPTYWLFIAPALLLMLFAQWRVRSAYAKWGQIANSRHLTGAQAAQKIMDENGLYGLGIQGIPGDLTDNYDPRSKTLNLSQGSATGSSVASLAIVAHELGHAQQDAQGSLLMQARSGLVPVVNIGSNLGPILFIVGFFLNFTPLIWLGIGLFSMAFVFALLTLPVELDASNRAMRMLTSGGLLVGQDEANGARSVLSAAALTYVAAMLMALLQLLYYVFLAFGSGRRRR
jgi:Zn-dependent membrane protease YugP